MKAPRSTAGPASVPGGALRERHALIGAWPPAPLKAASEPRPRRPAPGADKLLRDLDAAFDACEIKDGASLSFHHHYRNGDRVLNAVLACAAARGLRDLRLFASSIFPVHAPLVEHIRHGVVGALVTDYMLGPVADAVMNGLLPSVAVLQSHGGRARAIATGEIELDVAFVAAPLCDEWGAATGRGGTRACGPLGYPMVDAAHARRTVVLADEIQGQPIPRVDIPAAHVDHYLLFNEPGDPAGISSGATLPADTPAARTIAARTVEVIEASGLLQEGFSFQTGAGGFSLAAVAAIGEALRRCGVRGDFLAGGITGPHVQIVRQSLARRIRDVQSFDLAAVRSSIDNAWHEAMSAEEYASPRHPRAAVNDLSVMLLGAAEIDRNFNINVALGGDGRLVGGPGGHPDAAAGAKLSIVTTALSGGGFAKVVEEAACVVTPGRDVDVLVTDEGVAVNPAQPQLAQRLRDGGVRLVTMDELIARAAALQSRAPRRNDGRAVAVVETREGGLGDAIRAL